MKMIGKVFRKLYPGSNVPDDAILIIGDNFRIEGSFTIKGNYFEVGDNFQAGENFQAGDNFRAGKNFKSGDYFQAGNNFEAGDNFRAGYRFRAGFNFTAGFNFKAGDYFQAGDNFLAGENFVAGYSFQVGNNVTTNRTLLSMYIPECVNEYEQGKIRIGCEVNTIKKWEQNLRAIAEKHNFKLSSQREAELRVFFNAVKELQKVSPIKKER